MTSPPKPRSRVFANALWSLSGFIVTTVIMFAAVRLYVANLGLEAYGIFTLAMSVLGIAGVLNLGLGEATTKYVAQYHARGQHDRVTMVVFATGLIYCGLGFVVTTILALVNELLARRVLGLDGDAAVSAAAALRMVAWGFFPLVSMSVFLGYFDGQQRYRVSQLVVIARTVVSFGAGATAVLLGGDVVDMLTGIVGAYWVVMVVLAALAIRELTPVPRTEWRLRAQLNELIKFGLFTGLTGIGTTALGQVDKVLVGSLVGLEAVSIYGVAQAAASKLLAFANTTSRVLMPYFSARAGDDAAQAQPFYRAWRTSVLVCTSLATLIIAGAPWFVDIWLGPVTGPRVLFPLLIFTALYGLHCINAVPYHFLIGRGHAAVTAYFTLGGGVVSLGAISLLGPWWGVNGAVAANVCFVLGGFGMTARAVRLLGEVPAEFRLRTGSLSALATYLVVVLTAHAAGNAVSPDQNRTVAGLLASLVAGSLVMLLVVGLEWRRERSWFSAARPVMARLRRRR